MNRLIANVNIKKLSEKAVIPTYGSEYSAGADLYVVLDGPVTINPGDTYMFHIGIALEIPEGFAGLVYPRSGLASKRGLALANKVGVIDADYRGEIMVPILNHSREPQVVNPGDRIAQLVITPFLTATFTETEELGFTDRGLNGFGSTGQ